MGELRIKGTAEGLLLSLGEGDLAELLTELEELLQKRFDFFRGGRVALEVGERDLAAPEIEKLRALLSRYEVTLVALVSRNNGTRATAKKLGLEVTLRPDSSSEMESGLVVRRTLRSGQVVRHPGHVLIIGDVNPGAEIVAGGDVVVWGHLRGVVHAGALGNEKAVVCALDLSPLQLRIGPYIARSPEEGHPNAGPEMAFVHQGRIVAEPWLESARHLPKYLAPQRKWRMENGERKTEK